MDSITTVPIWILFPNLDPFLWSNSALSKLASKIGKPLFSDLPTTCKATLSFARVMVETDIAGPLPDELLFSTPYHEVSSQRIAYEWMPYYCESCKKLGHTKDHSKPNAKGKQNDKDNQKGKKRKNTPAVTSSTLAPMTSECSEPGATSLNVEVLDMPLCVIRPKLDTGITLDNPFETLCVVDNGMEVLLEAAQEVYDCPVNNLHAYGCEFSWTNKHNDGTRVWSRLDRALVNANWLAAFPCSAVHVMLPGVSDHSPLLVKGSWSVSVKGSAMFNFFRKLSLLKDGLKSLHHEGFSNLPTRVKKAWVDLQDCQQQLQSAPSNITLMSQEATLLAAYKKLKRRQQSIVGHITDHNGNVVQGVTVVNAAFASYYKELLGEKHEVQPLDRDFIASGACLTEANHHSLCAVVTNEEIKAAIFSIGNNKSPGHDGYSASVRDFRPIACCTILYKTISKILVNRMKPYLPHLVGQEQAAFVHGRYIHENIMVSQSLLKGYNTSSCSPRCLIKVDIKKAFDSVQWLFIKDMLLSLHFPKQFTIWIMGCISSTWYTLRINGGHVGFFHGQAGLRQGDPLSPYLFVLAMEMLSRQLRILCRQPQVSFHPKCARLSLTHLIFADDLMVFVRGDVPSATAAAQALSDFVQVSGLLANVDKTNIYFGGVPDQIKQAIMVTTGYTEGMLPFKYLGLPLHDSKLTVSMYEDLLCKVRNIVHHWTTKLLSYAGRLQLLNSIFFGLENYWTSTLLLPKTILKILNQCCRDYLWNVHDNTHKLYMKSWKSCCCPWAEGGFNIKEILSWNRANLGKWIWRVMVQADSVRDSLVQLAGGITEAQALIAKCVVGGFFQAKLPTIDCLARRGLPLVNWCILCKHTEESHSHLFFQCDFSAGLWYKILHWLKIRGRTDNFWTELEWCRSRKTRKHWKMGLLRCCLATTVYMIWQERNMRIFRDRDTDVGVILRQLQYAISAKIFSKYEQYSDEIVDVLSYSSWWILLL
ncbi:uncharacterized protein LOC141588596 [Silene latifolia]|uniref:uncharacterized protein LOC141588596 n=1 Tax=Silene latifolia TaxID=37657 RepID=UPI003D76BC13